MGFTSGKTCDTAVCVPADAHLRLEGISETLQRTLNVGPIAEVVMTRFRRNFMASRALVCSS